MSTVYERLYTFRKSHVDGKLQKWDKRAPSMASMARAFYRFAPIKGEKDRVVCAVCSVPLTEWQNFEGNPLVRHATVNEDCWVAKLAQVSVMLTQGRAEATSIQHASLASFAEAPAGLRGENLAAQGFVFMPEKPRNTLTLGCLGCRCFPQSGLDTPSHLDDCPVKAVLTATSTVTPRRTSALVRCPRRSNQLLCTQLGTVHPSKDKEKLKDSGEACDIDPDGEINGDGCKDPDCCNDKNDEDDPMKQICGAIESVPSSRRVSLQRMIAEVISALLTSKDSRSPDPSEKITGVFRAVQEETHRGIEKLLADAKTLGLKPLQVINSLEVLAIAGLDRLHDERMMVLNAEMDRVIKVILAEGQE